MKVLNYWRKAGYGYKDISYDVFKWVDPAIKSKGKVKCGIKTCRFVQPKDGSKCVIPNKLRELLKARKDTRKLIKFKTVETISGEKFSGLLDKDEDNEVYKVAQQNKEVATIKFSDVSKVYDTYTEFEKSVFDGLQLAFKMTANSLYGQLGASTSPVYLKILLLLQRLQGEDCYIPCS